jgi:hypothetical protein
VEQTFLHDKLLKPNDNLIYSIIGDAGLIWKQTFSYLSGNSKDVSINWKYSDCGKYWVCITQKKKNTIFRLRILKENSFNMAFPFGDKSEPFIMQSKLPESIKKNFMNAKRYNSTRYICIETKDSEDYENVKMLIDLKLMDNSRS